jgi:hypothetical protein
MVKLKIISIGAIVALILFFVAEAYFIYANLELFLGLIGNPNNIDLLIVTLFFGVILLICFIILVAKSIRFAIVSQENTTKSLKVIDELLGKLPEKEITKFGKSKDFKVYEKAMQEHGFK